MTSEKAMVPLIAPASAPSMAATSGASATSVIPRPP